MTKQFFTYLVLASFFLNSNVFAGKIKKVVLKKMDIKKFTVLVKNNSHNKQELELAFRNAAVNGLTDYMKVLVMYGVDINAVGPPGKPAIYHTINKGHENATKFLMSQNNLHFNFPCAAEMVKLAKKNDSIKKIVLKPLVNSLNKNMVYLFNGPNRIYTNNGNSFLSWGGLFGETKFLDLSKFE